MKDQVRTNISKWIAFKDMNKAQKIIFNSVDSKRIIALFDNGDVIRFDEDHPFAELTHYFILPELP